MSSRLLEQTVAVALAAFVGGARDGRVRGGHVSMCWRCAEADLDPSLVLCCFWFGCTGDCTILTQRHVTNPAIELWGIVRILSNYLAIVFPEFVVSMRRSSPSIHPYFSQLFLLVPN